MTSHWMGGQKIYYLDLLRASEGMLSRWSRLHLQSLAPTPVSRRVEVRRPVVKIITESLSQHDEKNVVPTPLSGIRVGEEDSRENSNIQIAVKILPGGENCRKKNFLRFSPPYAC
jgi:hypothetical protein